MTLELTFYAILLLIPLALIFFSIGWNLLGDGLNTVLNPYRT
jgi:ABC-type dipeptide/oligopeptide/nickel transport system permease subunit